MTTVDLQVSQAKKRTIKNIIISPELFIGFEKNKKPGSHMNDVALYRQKQKSHYFYT